MMRIVRGTVDVISDIVHVGQLWMAPPIYRYLPPNGMFENTYDGRFQWIFQATYVSIYIIVLSQQTPNIRIGSFAFVGMILIDWRL